MKTKTALRACVLAPLLAVSCASSDGRDPGATTGVDETLSASRAPGATTGVQEGRLPGSGVLPPSFFNQSGYAGPGTSFQPSTQLYRHAAPPVAIQEPQATYFTVKSYSPKFCRAPYTCNAWLMRPVNGDDGEQLVSGIDFSRAGLNEDEIALVQAAPSEELLLYGTLAPYGASEELEVLAAYRGMPGVPRADDQTFYKVTYPAPLTVYLLNGHEFDVVSTISVAQVGHRVQSDWLIKHVHDASAIARGSIRVAVDDKAGMADDHVLDATQVYMRIPEKLGPCEGTRYPNCCDGQKPTFTRSPDRCLIFTGCATMGVCTPAEPSCDTGYELVSWATLPNACQASVCDPLWAH